MKTLSTVPTEKDNPASQLSWEQGVQKKVNFLVFISILNLAIGFVYFLVTGVTIIHNELIFALIALPFVFVVNRILNYIWAFYWFFITDFVFTTLITLKLGMDSYIILSFFPMIISMMQLLGRKELLKHLIILSCACVLSIITIVLGLHFGDFTVYMDPVIKKTLASIIIVLCFSTTIILTITMIKEFIHQEGVTKKALAEKEILLAEVYHRVKNNLNIITSLLNLKKNNSDSKEVIEALEICQNRVFSIALVHQSIVNSPNVIGLNFNTYIHNLSKEIQKSLEIDGQSEIELDCDEIQLDMTKAIPCGLILNELLTNAFKYAQAPNQILRIHIRLKQKDGKNELTVRDNGPGVPAELLKNSQNMGVDLIKSLAEQIDADYTFVNENGLVFSMAFLDHDLKN